MDVRFAALLGALFALSAPAATQPEDVADLKGGARLFVESANRMHRALCEQAIAARDEASLQQILNGVDDLFKEQAEEVRSAADDLEFERRLVGVPNNIDDARKRYARRFAALIVIEQVRERVRGCVRIALDGLGEPGALAGTGNGAAGSGTARAGVELCQSQAGPLGCTGRFSGNYQLECSGGGAPPSRDAGTGTIAFFSDGTVELRLQGGTTSLSGRIDASGIVSIATGDARFSQRWEGSFRVQATAGGALVVGGGTYESRVTGPDGQVNNTCRGTFLLPGPA
jgi:hypothetical protein